MYKLRRQRSQPAGSGSSGRDAVERTREALQQADDAIKQANRADYETQIWDLASGDAHVKALVPIVERHLREEVAEGGNRALMEEASLSVRDVYRRLKSEHFVEWLRTVKPAWESVVIADIERSRLLGIERPGRLGRPAVQASVMMSTPLLSGALFALGASSLAVLPVVGAAFMALALRLGSTLDEPQHRRDQAVWELRYASARDTLDRMILERCIRPDFRELINSLSKAQAQRTLTIEAEGLAELSDPRYEIATASKDQLQRLMERMPGGSIGIAGPRGVGKTTLLRSVSMSREHDVGAARVTVLLSAPVRYDARDFILTLFAKTCQEVIGTPIEASLTTSPGSPSERTPTNAVFKLLLPGGLSLIAIALAVTAVDHFQVTVRASTAISAGLALVGYTMLGLGLSEGFRRKSREALAASEPESSSTDLVVAAGELMREIRFQQSFTSGYSGQLKLAVGIEATVGASASYALAQRQKSLPELVDQFRAFVGLVASERGGVCIAIDELDKVDDPHEARLFLNEIKAVFGITGCYYLVSVSDEALSSFDARGVPLRDVFDSSFDDLVLISPLALAESERLLRRRIVGLTPPFAALCHMLSGGIARELIRTARELAALSAQAEEPLALRDVARDLADSKFRRGAYSARILLSQCRDINVDKALAWIETLTSAPFDSGSIRSACRLAPVEDARKTLGSVPDELVKQTVAYFYFLATVVDFMAAVDKIGDERFQWRDQERQTTDALARVREQMGLNVRLSISAIENIRRALALDIAS
jgi:hypothetical protein